MAKTETLTLEIEAQLNDAMRQIQRLQKELQELRRTAEKPIDVEVDATKAERSVNDLLKTVQKLSGEDAEIILALRGAEIQQEINDIRVDLATLNSTDAEIEIEIARLAELNGDLDQIKGAIKEVDAAKAEVTITADTTQATQGMAKARGEIDQIPRSAGGANSALANMYGNVAGEAGAVFGAIGPVNVAIGQMAEYAADAKFAGEGLGSALGSMAKVAGPIAALSAGLFVLSKAMEAASTKSKLAEETTAATSEAAAEASGNIDLLEGSIAALVETAFAGDDAISQLGASILQGLVTEDNITEIAKVNTALGALGLTAQDLGPIIVGLADDQKALDSAFDDGVRTYQDLAAVVPNVTKALQEVGLGEYADEVGIAILRTDDLGAAQEELERIFFDQGMSVDDAQAKAQELIKTYGQEIAAVEQLDDVQENNRLNDFADTQLDLAAAADIATAALIGEIEAANRDWTSFQVWAELLRIQEDLPKPVDAATEALERQAEATARINRLNEQYVEDLDAAVGVGQEYADEQNRMTITSDELANVLLSLEDPLTILPEKWETLISQIAAGNFDIFNSIGLINELAHATNLDAEEVVKLADAEAKLREEKLNEQLKADAAALLEFDRAVADLGDTIADIDLDDIANISGALESEFNKVDDIFAGLKFDVDFQPALNEALKGLDSFGPDLQTLADEWANILEGKPIDIFGNVRADDAEFQEKIAALTNLVQEGAVNAFDQGGVAAANTFVQSTAAQIAAATGLDISEVYRIMGLPPDGRIDTFIKPQIDAEAKADALAILDSLMGVDPDNPVLAYISLQVQTGDIEPQVGEAMALLLAKKYGIDVEAKLAEFTPEQLAEAQAELAAWFGGNPVAVPTELDPEGAETGAQGLRQAEEDEPITFDSDLATDKAEQDANKFKDKKRETTVDVGLATLVAAALLTTFIAQPRTAEITAEANVALANLLLNLTARDRTSDINVRLPNYFDAEGDLNRLARDRHSTVRVHMVTNPTGQPLSNNPVAAFNQLAQEATVEPMAMAMAAPMAAPMALAADTGAGVTTTVFAPSAPAVLAPASVTNNNNLNVEVRTAVVGSRYDVERVVAKSLRSYTRLNGRR